MKKRRKYILLIIVIVIGSIGLVYDFTNAKYISNTVWNYYLKSKGFYLNSNFLDTVKINNVNNIWDGNSVYFNIRNNLNQTVISEYDIEYSVSCEVIGDASAYSTCHLNGGTTNTINGTLSSIQECVNNTSDGINVSAFEKTECEALGYKWDVDISSEDLFFDVVLTDVLYEIKDVIVDITVNSTAPYTKTLLGRFTLYKVEPESSNITMIFNKNLNYNELIISNPNLTSKCVKIEWDPSKLLIDMNNERIDSYNTNINNYVNFIRVNLNEKSSDRFIFYNTDIEGLYTVEDFTLTDDQGCQ